MTTQTLKSSPLTGTGTLIRLALRRDRVRLPMWIAAHGLFVLYIGSALPQLAPTKADLAGISSLLSQPVGRMFTGPAFGLDDVTHERFFASGYAPYLVILAALMSLMLVTRHTRKEEQLGHTELIRANVAGRHASLTAGLAVATLASVAAGLVVVVLAIGIGYAVAGSVLVGAATTLGGLAFAGIAGVTAQLSEFSRSAAGMAGAVLGVSFILRALGDMVAVGGSALSWASPLGWAAQTAPYVHNRWAPLLLLAAVAIGATVLAFVLQSRRDFGASLLPPRLGRARAAASLGTPWGLALRLHRGGLLGWGAAIVLLGAVDGLFTQAMLDAGDEMPPELSAVFGTQQLLDGYVSFLSAFTTIFIAAYLVSAMQTLRTEEDAGRADMVLAAPVSRTTWMVSHLTAITAGAVMIAAATGLATGIAAAVVTGDGGLVVALLGAHLALLPAALVLLGVCAVLFGVLPRFMALLGWLLVAVLGIVELFADLLDIPEGFRVLSPMWHLAAIPVEEFALPAFLIVLAVALVTAVLGTVGFRRRQIRVV